MFLSITLTLLFVLAMQVSATRFQDCGSKSQVTAVDFVGCSDSDSVCIVDRETIQNISIKFTSEDESKSVGVVVYGQILDFFLPFEVEQPDGCESGISCPVTDGANYSYHGSVDMRELFPQASAIIEWYLKDDVYDNIVCVQIFCKIK
ncbi:NPC intracellular cholesterol transporter 2 a [Araneus ventricosus]|uniref:NPC intracellular cholesterol transporter 2 a n=1 Tax=Araneus ventricosus TaxID=182803 RepID=A0A4Y2GCI8_ARAVE|nr:NPC intracellular cholesterol transporter 2 a [Araneus ventricosus]